MFWLGFIIGLFVGANVGIVVAGMLYSAKNSDQTMHPAETIDTTGFVSGMESATDRDSTQPTREPAQNQKEYTDNNI